MSFYLPDILSSGEFLFALALISPVSAPRNTNHKSQTIWIISCFPPSSSPPDSKWAMAIQIGREEEEDQAAVGHKAVIRVGYAGWSLFLAAL